MSQYDVSLLVDDANGAPASSNPLLVPTGGWRRASVAVTGQKDSLRQ
jgi:hypothetical protein